MSIEPARRDSRGRWRPGQSGNPEGRRVELDLERRRLRDLARAHDEEAIGALREIMLDRDAQTMGRVAAAKELLVRGYGTPSEEATLEALERFDENREIRFVWPMSIDGVAIEEGELIDDEEPPALPPAAA